VVPVAVEAQVQTQAGPEFDEGEGAAAAALPGPLERGEKRSAPPHLVGLDPPGGGEGGDLRSVNPAEVPERGVGVVGRLRPPHGRVIPGQRVLAAFQ